MNDLVDYCSAIDWLKIWPTYFCPAVIQVNHNGVALEDIVLQLSDKTYK